MNTVSFSFKVYNLKAKPHGDGENYNRRDFLLKGVTIGARSIIDAGPVVTCSIPSDEIWADNPARFIKKLI